MSTHELEIKCRELRQLQALIDEALVDWIEQRKALPREPGSMTEKDL